MHPKLEKAFELARQLPDWEQERLGEMLLEAFDRHNSGVPWNEAIKVIQYSWAGEQ